MEHHYLLKYLSLYLSNAIIPDHAQAPYKRIESIDDDEMIEFDFEEHHEFLSSGIPQHLGILSEL